MLKKRSQKFQKIKEPKTYQTKYNFQCKISMFCYCVSLFFAGYARNKLFCVRWAPQASCVRRFSRFATAPLCFPLGVCTGTTLLYLPVGCGLGCVVLLRPLCWLCCVVCVWRVSVFVVVCVCVSFMLFVLLIILSCLECASVVVLSGLHVSNLQVKSSTSEVSGIRLK